MSKIVHSVFTVRSQPALPIYLKPSEDGLDILKNNFNGHYGIKYPKGAIMTFMYT